VETTTVSGARALLHTLLAIGSLAGCHWAGAVPVSGHLAAPSGALPALTLHAWSQTANRLYSFAAAGGEPAFHIDLPPGRYYLFAAPADPGAPAIYGAYTEFAACTRDRPREECREHRLATLVVARRPLDRIDLSDWYLDTAVTATLDHLLGRPDEVEESEEPDSELAAPRFSEYPVAPYSGPSAPALAVGGEPRAERDRAALTTALASKVNFAGRGVIVALPCGTDCESAAIVDLPSGRVAYPTALASVPLHALCGATRALQFRRDSRLLTVSAPEGAQFMTRYFVWDAESGVLRQIGTLASVSERCVPGR
jgi:hypothetical protein